MASLISLSPSSRFYQTPTLRCNSIPPAFTQLKGGRDRRFVLLQVKCVSEQDTDAEKSKVESTPPSSSYGDPPSSSSTSTSTSTYNWCAVLGGIGFLESSYLTFLKLTNSEAFCPIGNGGSCDSVLSSDYSVVFGFECFKTHNNWCLHFVQLSNDFGVPLPLIGMVAYGLVATIGLQLGGKKIPLNLSESDGQWLLLMTTTSMAVASTYFLYVLNSQFAGESCLYCLTSALLSFSLFAITMKNLGSQEMLQMIGLQLCVASLVVATLNSSYHDITPVARSSSEIPYFKTEVTTHSSPLAISLAKHLHSAGAKLYGAFWCTHCQEQKEIFGREAAKILDYVECFPDGYKKGTTMIKECLDVNLEGFPTWVINGEVHSGELEFSELAELTGIRLEDLDQSN
ncbi:hypothetical protein Leryth_019366 [Lithospermum erythrorhizon]|nr:hypothetical protein Leryth_019366 [Lithospermum erythrorhizon]